MSDGTQSLGAPSPAEDETLSTGPGPLAEEPTLPEGPVEPQAQVDGPRSGKGSKQQRRREKRDVHGWVVLDKPIGMTSTHAVAVVKRLFKAKRAGHAGTLDPLASGCLPIALGEATKTVPFVMDGRKGYRFTVRWGEERDTDDAEGRVVADQRRAARPPRRSAPLLPRFIGTIEQVPPHYSAIKIDGERAYDLARDGEDRRARAPGRSKSTASTWSRPPTPTMRYSRRNAARAPMSARSPAIWAGCSAATAMSARCAGPGSGPFAESDMIPLEQLEALCHRAASGEGKPRRRALPVETALDDIPALAVSRADAARLQRGQAVLLRGRDAPVVSGTVYVTVAGRLVALAEVDRGEIVPKRVFNLAGLHGRAGRQERCLTMSITPSARPKSSSRMPSRPATPVRRRFRSRSCRNASPT